VRTIINFISANYHAIVNAYKRGGPIIIEVPLGFILMVFGFILLDPRINVIHTQVGYSGLKLLIDSDTFWGTLFLIVGILKFWVTKPVQWRIVSTGIMMFVYISLCANFFINSPSGFVWAFFLFFFILCAVAEGMLYSELLHKA
jgi:hypothetical protein